MICDTVETIALHYIALPHRIARDVIAFITAIATFEYKLASRTGSNAFKTTRGAQAGTVSTVSHCIDSVTSRMSKTTVSTVATVSTMSTVWTVVPCIDSFDRRALK